MNSLFALVAAAVIAAPSFTAATLDGRTISGELVRLDNEKLVLRTAADGEQEIPRSQLLSLTASAEKKRDSLPPIAVELLGESTLHASSFEVQGEKVRVTRGDGDALELPARQVRAVKFVDMDADTSRRFDELLEGDTAADVIAVRKKDSDTTTFLEGIVGDVNAHTLRFRLDGDDIPVKRDRIHGIIYFRGKQASVAEPVGVVTTFAGDRLATRELRLDGDMLLVTTNVGIEIRQPLAAVSQLDFSAGKVQYLADLKAESFAWTPYLGLAETPAPLAEFYNLRRNRGWSSATMHLGGKSFSRGVGLTSRSEVTYRVPNRGRRFQAVVGIDDAVGDRGHVLLSIFADDKKLFEKPIGGADEPREVDLDFAGARCLRIVVDYGNDADVADYLNLCEARISR